MFKRFLIIACLIVPGFTWCQDTKPDSIANATDTSMTLSIDSSLDYDELFNELDLFLDSILAPRSYTLLSLSAGQGYFNYAVRTLRGPAIKQVKKVIWSPTVGYYDKSGLGITLTSYIVNEMERMNAYQFSIGASYDYIKNRDLATGISYSRYFTKRALRFYTSPLESELNGYFLWRKSWLQPGITANYGWGSKTRFSRQDSIYKTLVSDAVNTGRLNVVDLDTVTIYTRNTKSMVDFSLSFSLRHDFYWLDIFSNKDHIRFSPLLSVSAGTQKFGFNQSTNATGPLRVASTFNNTKDVSLQEKFQLLSTTLYLRGEYSYKKFFIQPQVLFDYYFPGDKNNFIASFSINTGFMF